MFKELNPLLHSELRLAVMSLLISVEEADFVYIRQQTKATAGNLSVQLDKLSKAGYVEITKTFKGKMPCTLCRILSISVNKRKLRQETSVCSWISSARRVMWR